MNWMKCALLLFTPMTMIPRQTSIQNTNQILTISNSIRNCSHNSLEFCRNSQIFNPVSDADCDMDHGKLFDDKTRHVSSAYRHSINWTIISSSNVLTLERILFCSFKQDMFNFLTVGSFFDVVSSYISSNHDDLSVLNVCCWRLRLCVPIIGARVEATCHRCVSKTIPKRQSCYVWCVAQTWDAWNTLLSYGWSR